MRADVAIVIVTYNSAAHIEACISSVFQQRRNVSQQVIVLDNGSTDETVAVLQQRCPDVTVLLPGHNLGFAAGVNMAARHADADYLLLLNPDTILLDHAVDVIVEFARRHPEFGLYGGRTLNRDGTVNPSSCWGAPSVWSLAMFACGLSTLAKRNRFLDPESLGSWERDSVREVGVVSGCFLLARLAVWNELHGFDEHYFMYGEDADLAARARAAGYRPAICPQAQLIHDVGQSSATPLSKGLLLYRGKASYVRSHWEGFRRPAGIWLLVAGVALRAGTARLACFTSKPLRQSGWWGLWQQRRNWILGYSAQGPGSAPKPPAALVGELADVEH